MNCKTALTGLSFSILFLSQVKAQQSQFFISPHVSTQGLGMELKYAPGPGLNLRSGVSFLSFDFNTSYNVRSYPADAEVDVNMRNAHLMFDVHPFVKSNSFAQKLLLTAGAGYFWKVEGNALAVYHGDVEMEGFSVPGEEVGELYGTVRWQKFAPYMGFGFENPFPKRRVNFGLAVGAYYMGKPEVEVTGTKFLTDTESDEAEFRDNVSSYRFLPVIQLNLNIGL